MKCKIAAGFSKLLMLLSGLVLVPFEQPSFAQEPSASWRKHAINPFSPYEAVGVADFNKDGKLDVFSGDTWYSAPDWEPHKVREIARVNSHYQDRLAGASWRCDEALDRALDRQARLDGNGLFGRSASECQAGLPTERRG
jgi:hypothetical protein